MSIVSISGEWCQSQIGYYFAFWVNNIVQPLPKYLGKFCFATSMPWSHFSSNFSSPRGNMEGIATLFGDSAYLENISKAFNAYMAGSIKLLPTHPSQWSSLTICGQVKGLFPQLGRRETRVCYKIHGPWYVIIASCDMHVTISHLGTMASKECEWCGIAAQRGMAGIALDASQFGKGFQRHIRLAHDIHVNSVMHPVDLLRWACIGMNTC